jgi:hypothetical protein
MRSDFDSFLFASINEDKKDEPLSVLSVLARSDVDPWQEAAILDRLPGEAATRRLTSLIANLPGGPSARAGAIAARLIALLPRGATSRNVPREAAPAPVAATPWRDIRFAILIAFLLSAGSILASLRPPAQADSAPSRTTPISSSQTPPTTIGQ